MREANILPSSRWDMARAERPSLLFPSSPIETADTADRLSA